MSANALKKNQQGAVLLFAMLLLMVMITIGFVLASLLYREIQGARAFPDSLQAFYAAESGIEQNLDIVSQRRKEGSLLEVVDSPGQPATQNDLIDRVKRSATLSSPAQLSSNGAHYFIDTAETRGSVESVDLPIIYRRGTEIEMYDPDTITSGAGARSVRFFWTPTECTNTDTDPDQRMEISYTVIDPASSSLTEEVVKTTDINCSGETSTDSEFACMHTANWLATTKNYLIRVSPFDCTIPRMRVQFYSEQSAGGSTVSIPSIARITSVGEGKFSQRRITATTHWIPQASGLTDFVVFSIDKIEKLSD